jgi:colicin import membrane protein
MERRLKTYQTSSGFFDLAVAAPSMKAAAGAWGSRTNVFKQGFAKETAIRRLLPPPWQNQASF